MAKAKKAAVKKEEKKPVAVFPVLISFSSDGTILERQKEYRDADGLPMAVYIYKTAIEKKDLAIHLSQEHIIAFGKSSYCQLKY